MSAQHEPLSGVDARKDREDVEPVRLDLLHLDREADRPKAVGEVFRQRPLAADRTGNIDHLAGERRQGFLMEMAEGIFDCAHGWSYLPYRNAVDSHGTAAISARATTRAPRYGRTRNIACSGLIPAIAQAA